MHDDRHRLVDQRDRPVLHLARGIAFGVDVADFLELQRAFQRQRIVRAAAQIQHVARLRDGVRHRLDLGIVRQRLVDRRRGLDQVADDLGFLASPSACPWRAPD